VSATVDWNTRVITIYQADMLDLGGGLYQLDIGALKQELGVLMASEVGMPFDDPIFHKGETVLSGVTYARFVEFINGYTCTISPAGAYQVTCSGANHNLQDVYSNLTGPTLLPNLSAGLIVAPEATAPTASEVAAAVWDEVLTGGTHNIQTSAGRRLRALQEYEGYESGYIYINTVDGVAGTEPFENGTVNNPVSNIADAIALSTALKINQFFCTPGSAITLTQDMPFFVLTGKTWSLDCAGYDLSSTYVSDAFVTGVSTSDTLNVIFDKCLMFMTTIGSAVLTQCGIHTSLTMNEASNYTLIWCYQAAGSGGSSTFDFAVDNITLQVDNWSGKLDLQNMMSLDKAGIYGIGAIDINANCLGGTATLAGSLKYTGNDSGTVTVDDEANVTSLVIHHDVAQGPGTGSNQIQLAASASAVDGAYDPSMIYIFDGTGAGQSRLIYEYDGTTKMATVDRNWKVLPDLTSKYRIIANPGREHVNEGLAQGGTSTTITLNALASSQDNAYTGQSVFIRSGTGEDQVGVVGTYDGTTKVATLADGRTWSTIPDTTSGYAMIPMHVHPISEIKTGVDQALNDSIIAKILQNKKVTYKAGGPNGGKMIIYDNDGTTVLLEAAIWEDEGGNTEYRGQGIERQERLDTP
jgi:hypothetical protein